ncbi:MAG: protein of unknown function [Nitrospira sp.]
MKLRNFLPEARRATRLSLASSYVVTCAVRVVSAGLFFSIAISHPESLGTLAEAASSITRTTGAGDLGTQVTSSGNVYGIKGGQTVGSNLFHSFNQFSVGSGDIAQFQTNNLSVNSSMSNILSRVTGGSPSSIFGAIDSATYYPGANLFLMNPAGVIFGPTATLNIGGMATFTTADYLKFAESNGVAGVFYANPASNSVLTTANVAAFGFLGSNPAAIAIQGSHLTVSDGTGISLVGGNVTIQSGRLSAPSGQINIASVAAAGEVTSVDFMPAAGMTRGNVSLTQGTLLDVSADSAGTVRIRGGQLVIDHASIAVDTGTGNGAPIAIDIHATGDVSVSTVDVPALTARTTGSGDAGEIRITSQNLNVAGSAVDNFVVPVIDTHTSGAGKAGDVTITATDTIAASSDQSGIIFFIDSGTIGPAGGHGGNVTLTAKNIDIQHASINTGDFVANNLFEEAAGSGGNLTVNAETIQLTDAFLVTDGFFAGRGGDITISGRDVQLTKSSALSSSGRIRSGTVRITADTLSLDESQIDTTTVAESGGGIIFNGRIGRFTNGSTVQSSTFGEGNAGNITFTATERLTFSDDPGEAAPNRPSGLFTTSNIGTGNAAEIRVNTSALELRGGARFDASTSSNGNGGHITVAADTIVIDGARPFPAIEGPLFDIVTSLASGIYSRTVQSEFCTGPCGNAGLTSITTETLNLSQGGRIDSSTNSAGTGGDITVRAGQIAIAGTTADGNPSGVFATSSAGGSGGNITLLAGNSVTISEGAQVSASTSGPGNAGSITIEGLASPAQSVLITGAGSGIFTDTQAAGAGGNIFVNADSVTLSDGGTLSATTSGSNHGGDIQVNAATINLSGLSTINALSSAGDNTAGNAGNIALRATQQITAVNSFLNTDTVGGSGLGGNILLRAPTITVDGAVLSTSTSGAGNAGNILLEGQRINSQGAGADLFAVTSGSGHGGTVTLRGLDGPGSSAESVTISGASRVHSLTAADGTAGDISIHAGQFTLTDHATINADTFGAGAAGAITIAATQQALISGSSTAISSSSDSGATGHAGQITLSAPTVMIENGGRILTSTTGGAAGGDIGITAGQSFIMTNGASISANSTGTGNAGSVQITAGNQFAMTNSTITTEANQSSGGIIKITTNPSGTVDLSNSTISASVLDGTGGGGSVSLDPQFVILQNSQILAQAQQGPGGNILINITNGGTFLPDATSVVSASSQSGVNGTVTIQAPIAPAGGKIQPLGKAPLQVTALLSQRCAAIARGEVSSFVVAGRDTLPTEPGGWLTSPLAGITLESPAGNVTQAPPLLDGNTLIISLRRIAPPGFLKQGFPDGVSSDCTS